MLKLINLKTKDYGNIVHLPRINIKDDATPVLHIVPPPELHPMLGPGNTLFDEMSKVWPESEEWLNGCHIKKCEYHDSQFKGTDCRKLLRNVDMLQELCPHEYHQSLNAFILFNNAVTSCYGRNLLQQYKTSLCNFKDAYLKLNISVNL